MEYIEKKMAGWEIKHGQIKISCADSIKAREIFKDFLGKTFDLETFKGNFKDVHFYEKESALRFSCPFFKNLATDDTIYIFAKNNNAISITDKEPNSVTIDESEQSLSKTELLEIIAKLTKENQELRKTNSSLFEYKDRLDKYENLEKIFDDEHYMEEWLERNIHRVIADLDVIDRQVEIRWSDEKKNRIDLLCLDKTTRELVIVENKVNGNKRTLDTQYLKYKAWYIKNLDETNEKYKTHNLKATKNLKVVIITDTIDDSLRSMCEINNIPLFLIDGGVIFDEIVPYNC